MPNYLDFHKSLTDELHGLKNRVRDLVCANAFDTHEKYAHWISDGEYKESALRAVLRRHLPHSFIVGRGFILTEHSTSTQIDVLIVDANKPKLFNDGDLMFVTPDCVRAVIEVKTSLPTFASIEECATKLGRVGKLCCETNASAPWLGIFSYEGTLQDSEHLLNSVQAAYLNTGAMINCVAYGKDHFVRFWERGERERGDAPDASNVAKFRAYLLDHLASAYFVGNVVDALSTLSRKNNAFAWYPLSDGKRVHMQAERILQER